MKKNTNILSSIYPYISIIRIEHWFKNAFMILGVVLAYFIFPKRLSFSFLYELFCGFLSVSLVASSNYVLNEILDAKTDRFHPSKQHRPIAGNKVKIHLAYAEWLILGLLGMLMAFHINKPFGYSGVFLWIMGILYNTPPFRFKEYPYLDVLSESVNNPIRLLLGWFVIIADMFPPVSLLISYWMYGAFFMGLKRFAEYRFIGDREKASKYRLSFNHYNQDRLLLSVFFYAISGSLFASIFIIRYHLELIFILPLLSGFFTYYLKLGLQKDSPVQHPEKLYQEKGFVLYTFSLLLIFILLMFLNVPALYDIFNVKKENKYPPLWTIEKKLENKH